MPALLLGLTAAQRRGGGFAEFGRDPLLSVACIALIVICVLWVVLARKISRNLDRNALRQGKKLGAVQAPKDIWRDPPPP
jgi:hypothetical protein